jgi:hypothetical protein
LRIQSPYFLSALQPVVWETIVFGYGFGSCCDGAFCGVTFFHACGDDSSDANSKHAIRSLVRFVDRKLYLAAPALLSQRPVPEPELRLAKSCSLAISPVENSPAAASVLQRIKMSSAPSCLLRGGNGKEVGRGIWP